MGFFNNLRDLFKGPDDTNMIRQNDGWKKSKLATQIVNLVDEIKKINSFDNKANSLSGITQIQLEAKSLDELERIRNSLSYQLSELTRQRQMADSKRESREASKWTGRKPQGMTDHEFDRFQRDDR